MSTPGIVFEGVSKIYPDGTVAVSDLSLTISQGELVVLMGPSGCGKTTTLRMVAGLEQVTTGQILIDGSRVDDLEPRERDVAMVFQSYALYPHKSAFQNIAYPLRLRRMSNDEITANVQAMASMLGIDDLLHKKPRHLSGGQQQRVAMGRAIVRDPAAFLLDEPLSNLDAKLRQEMRGEITRLQKELGVTTLYVTHDQVEAMSMGDRVAVFRKGRVQQVGSARELYGSPANSFVASVVGTPSMNFAIGTVDRDSEYDLVLMVGKSAIHLTTREIERGSGNRLAHGRDVVVGIRPDSLILGPKRTGRNLRGKVALVEDLGNHMLVHVDVPARRPNIVGVEDENESMDAARADLCVFRLLVPPGDYPTLGSLIDFNVGDESILLFDPETGDAL